MKKIMCIIFLFFTVFSLFGYKVNNDLKPLIMLVKRAGGDYVHIKNFLILSYIKKMVQLQTIHFYQIKTMLI